MPGGSCSSEKNAASLCNDTGNCSESKGHLLRSVREALRGNSAEATDERHEYKENGINNTLGPRQ